MVSNRGGATAWPTMATFSVSLLAARLVALKQKYDPMNFFRLKQDLSPASRQTSAANLVGSWQEPRYARAEGEYLNQYSLGGTPELSRTAFSEGTVSGLISEREDAVGTNRRYSEDRSPIVWS
jgi:Zn-dependent protease with chaperone function